ncbi:MAG: HAD hydrolase-like protein [Halobacteriota archaeon]
MVSLTRFCWRARPLITAHQKAVVGDRMYADRQMAQNVECDFICVSGGETAREQIDELRAEESQSLIAKDLGELLT